MRILEARLGLIVWASKVSPLDFGSRCQRLRFHFFCWRATNMTTSMRELWAANKQQFLHECNSHLALCKRPSQPLTAFMLPAEHVVVREWMDTLCKRRRCKDSEDQSAQKWPSEHAEAARVLGISMPSGEDPVWAQVHLGTLASLTPREKSLLGLHLALEGDIQISQRSWKQRGTDKFVDLLHTVGRSSSHLGAPRALLPRSRLVSLAQMRFVTPAEAFRFQGWDLACHGPSSSAVCDLTWSQAMDLCGNAFNGYSAAMSILIGLLWAQA